MVNLKLYFEEEDKILNIAFPSSGTFEDIIDKLLELKIPIADDSFLLTKGKKMDLEMEYNFEENQKITVRRQSSLECLIKFNDVTNKTKDAIIKRKVLKVSNGCGYRYICPGINLYGICENKSCKVYEKEVIQMIHENELNLVKRQGLMKCPICNCNVVAKTVGFYKCFYNIFGIKYNEEKDENEKFGVEIKDFSNKTINTDNTIFVNGKNVKVQKTDEENVSKFNETNGEVEFIKLVFQVKKF